MCNMHTNETLCCKQCRYYMYVCVCVWERECVWVCVCKVENVYELDKQGAVSIRKTVLQGMVIPMLKIRRPNGRLIFNMEITIRR